MQRDHNCSCGGYGVVEGGRRFADACGHPFRGRLADLAANNEHCYFYVYLGIDETRIRRPSPVPYTWTSKLGTLQGRAEISDMTKPNLTGISFKNSLILVSVSSEIIFV
jgi:hypothetical protein